MTQFWWVVFPPDGRPRYTRACDWPDALHAFLSEGLVEIHPLRVVDADLLRQLNSGAVPSNAVHVNDTNDLKGRMDL